MWKSAERRRESHFPASCLAAGCEKGKGGCVAAAPTSGTPSLGGDDGSGLWGGSRDVWGSPLLC